MSILIVDDTASQRLLLSAILKGAGYSELQGVASAEAAYAQLELEATEGTCAVDLILMDISMPEVDGIAACRAIKANRRLRDIPIIMVTASVEPEDLQLAFDAGALDYITKPPSRLDLLARVRAALRLKQEMDRRKAREQDLLDVTNRLIKVNLSLEQAMEQLDRQHRLLQEEQSHSERLLLNILPAPIAERLKHHEGVIADSFSEATVLFADLVDFTKLSARISPHALVALLNEIFSCFDRLAEKHGLEKIKTIGDAYMVAGGLPQPRPDHAAAVAEMALDMLASLPQHTSTAGEPLRLRIGIHSGPVVAGVIGTKKFIYDLWGDTVNTASRMESHGLVDGIQVTPETYAHLRELYSFQKRGTIFVKGKGEISTFLLTGRHAALDAAPKAGSALVAV